MILDEIVAATKIRVAKEKEQKSQEQYMKQVIELEKEMTECGFPFEQALKEPGISLICEVKKASPSKGVIAEDFDYKKIATEYEEAGASAISVLTEPSFFQGDLRYLEEISRTVQIPLLRKDFILEPYQIYQAKVMGASCILLICSILTKEQLTEYIKICDSIHLSALVEIHDETEAVMAISAGARIVGVNNRNLKDFTVDINNSLRLRHKIPKDILFVAESGIKTSADMKRLHLTGVDAVLIGETMMRSKDKLGEIEYLKSEITA